MLVSIILPCYNPPENWAENIINEYKTLSELIKDQIEIIIVKDGENLSLDNEVKLLESRLSLFKCISYKINRGKGYAIRRGVEEARGEIILYTDIDFPYKTESVLNIYSPLKNKECDVAIGIKNDAYYEHVPLARKILSKGLRKLIPFFLSIPITDTQCGLKGFIAEVKPTFLKTTIDRYLFDLEFIRLAYKTKYNLKAIQIELNENVHFRGMNYKILLPEMMNFMKLLLKSK